LYSIIQLFPWFNPIGSGSKARSKARLGSVPITITLFVLLPLCIQQVAFKFKGELQQSLSQDIGNGHQPETQQQPETMD
jgi:hypothetical protein